MPNDAAALAKRFLEASVVDAHEIMGALDQSLKSGEDLRESAAILTDHIWELARKVQLAALILLSHTVEAARLDTMISEVIATVGSKDRERRRMAAEILLAWVDYGHPYQNCANVTPQVVYEALARAWTHPDNVLRKRVTENFYIEASTAPKFPPVLEILLRAYDTADEPSRDRLEHAFETAAIRGLDIGTAVSRLERTLAESRRNACLATLVAHYIHRHDSKALDLFITHGGGTYECQEIGRIQPPIGSIAVEVLRAGLENADASSRAEAIRSLEKFAERGIDISLAIGSLGKALSDSTRVSIIRSTVGQEASRVLATAANKGLEDALAVLTSADQSGDKTTARNADSALQLVKGYPPKRKWLLAAEKLYTQARDRWSQIVHLSVYDDEQVIANVTPMLYSALRLDPSHIKSLALISDLLMEIGSYGDARERLMKLLELEPDVEGHQIKMRLLEIESTAARRSEIRSYLEMKWRTTETW